MSIGSLEISQDGHQIESPLTFNDHDTSSCFNNDDNTHILDLSSNLNVQEINISDRRVSSRLRGPPSYLQDYIYSPVPKHWCNLVSSNTLNARIFFNMKNP